MEHPTEIGFLEEIEIHDHAEDVKAVEIHGSNGTVEVSVTDETMFLFLKSAVDVAGSIHHDKGEIRDILRGGEEE